MSPAGLVVDYNLHEADAHRNFSHFVSMAEPFGLPHRGHTRHKSTETNSMEVVGQPRARDTASKSPLREPKDGLASRAARRASFFRSAQGGNCFLLSACSIAATRNILGIADIDASILQKDEQTRRFPEPFVGRGWLGRSREQERSRSLMKRVLITGAGGGIGRSLRETLKGVYPILRLSDRVALAPAREGEEVDRTELSDMAAVQRMVAGVDGIIHLGGISGGNQGAVMLEGHLIGLYNGFEAARRARVPRILFATSTHPLPFYPREHQLDHRVVPRPDSRYAVSKAPGDALPSLYS